MNGYDAEKVAIAEMQVGDLFETPMMGHSVSRVVAIVPCQCHDDWWHMAFEPYEGHSRAGELHAETEFPLTRLLPVVKYHAVSGIEFINRMKQGVTSDGDTQADH